MKLETRNTVVQTRITAKEAKKLDKLRAKLNLTRSAFLQFLLQRAR